MIERNREQKQQCKSRFHRQNRCCPLNSATLKLSDGDTRTIVEYDLARNGQDTVAASRQSIDADIRLLPDPDGMGGTFDLHQATQKNPWLAKIANEPTWRFVA